MIKETQTIITGRMPLASPADIHEPQKNIQNKSKKKGCRCVFPKKDSDVDIYYDFRSINESIHSTSLPTWKNFPASHGVDSHTSPRYLQTSLFEKKNYNNCLERGWLLVSKIINHIFVQPSISI